MTTIATKQKIEGVVRAEDKSGLFSFPTAAAAFRYRKKAFGTYAVRRLAVHEIRKGQSRRLASKKELLWSCLIYNNTNLYPFEVPFWNKNGYQRMYFASSDFFEI